MKDNINLTEIFGLTSKQSSILFSLQIAMTKKDIIATANQSYRDNKKIWLEEWYKNLNDQDILENYNSIIESIKEEISKSSGDLTWLYFVVFEAVLFKPYFPLNDSENKILKKLHYKNQEEYLKKVVKDCGYMKLQEFIERIPQTYKQVLNKISGRNIKIVLNVLTVLASAGLLATLGGVFASKIAVILVGSKFAGLHGAALVSACLAYLGGGAIAIGGAGMAGGVAVIVGGGALLGAASGGAATAFVKSVAEKAPELILPQTAKLEVAMREILLNAQQDTRCAQAVISQLKEQIVSLKKEVLDLKNRNNEDKKALKNLKQSIKYLEKAYDDMIRFKSSYEEGLNS